MAAEIVVDRLEHVRQRGPGQWSARCPAHKDRGPSLSVKETADGRVLMHCFAGCGIDQVLQAIHLEMDALFPPRMAPGAGHPPIKKRGLLPKSQALELLHTESLFVAVCAANLAHEVELTAQDRARLLKSAGRIAELLDESGW